MTETAETPVREADGRRLRWTEHRAQRREAFVVAGVAAIDQHGSAASAEQIAESAGVSRTVLYRYFRDRDDLRQAIADHVVAEVVATVLPNLQITPDSTPREVIGSTIGVIVEWLDEHPNLYIFLRDRRNGHGLETVEITLADQVASLLKIMMTFFGIDSEQAEPGAYGIVGFVESAGAWWLARRTISRDVFADGVCNAIWHLLEGTARASGVIIEYDEPLPFAALTEGPA
jgi:AcrR family transcriptional regulator